ncbi:hypothetical protein BO70DRAFT_286582, partial [Aspergillus heteromorphus CBS 117.55]
IPKMGKLNYLARRISGTKAGQAVSKDLKKRFPPGLSSRAAARDPVVEIDVTGKALTDEGFAQFIDDLLGCLKFRDDEHPMGLARVAEFHLQGNELTIASLPKLGEVIALSAGDIRELDISNNNIRVRTPADIEIWVAFLKSFEDCFVLKKLDLGSNPLGRMGVEHLARVYLKSDLNFLEDDADALLGGCGEEGDNEGGEGGEEDRGVVEGVAEMKVSGNGKENVPTRQKKSPSKAKVASTSNNAYILADPAELKKYACTRGLRSIPYFILSDVGMSNTSAIHLLSMLNVQRTPDHLLNFLPPGKALTLPESAPLCKSIIWRPCHELTAYTLRMLEVAEALRENKFDTESETNNLSDDMDGQPEVDKAAQKKVHDKLEIEYTRLCKRVRLEAIKKDGVHSSTIWSVSLKMMIVSRAILLDDKDRPGLEEPLEETEAEEPENPNVSDEQAEEHEPSTARHHDEDSSSEGPSFRHIEEIQPNVIQPGPFHTDPEAFYAEFPTLQEVREAALARQQMEEAQKEEEARLAEATAAGKRRDAQEPVERIWRFGLPTEAWRRVISEAVGADGILDREQQVRIMEYAADWNAVEYEQTIKGAEDHQQIWKLLETLKCFTYSYW